MNRDQSSSGRPPLIVGLGASAGGLQALERFFAAVPSDTQLAFIVVQHLSPNFETMMDDLLSRQTELPIEMATEDTVVLPGHVYVLPPKKQIIVANGKLLVTDKPTSVDVFLPIDHMFRSLGQDQRELSVGIILSGTGSDGSRGIEHIHRAGGIVLAQDEETASFDGMIRSAVNTGLVDLVLEPEAMPDLLERYANSPSEWRTNHDTSQSDGDDVGGIESIIRLLRRDLGIDFKPYKSDMIARRISRRQLISDAEDIDEYAELLRNNPDELSDLYRDMLIGVTGFFRDRDAYSQLEQKLLPALVESLPPDQELRIWVAATATGEEAYSIAMLVDEYFTARNLPVRCRIFATDVHQASLDIAGHGVYPESRVRDISPERLRRYFQKETAGYRVTAEIRRLVVFAAHNVISDAPFTKLHLVTCRNLFIYFRPEVQQRILTLFHFGLNVGGGLWLGSSENPAELGDEFEVVDSQWKFYRKLRDVRLSGRIKMPETAVANPKNTNSARGKSAKAGSHKLLQTYDELLGTYMPTAMLVTPTRALVQTFGGASQFLKPVDGRASNDVADQLDASLRTPLSTIISKAQRDREIVTFAGIHYPTADGDRLMHLSARPMQDSPDTEPLLLVEFKLDNATEIPASTPQEVSAETASGEHVDALEKELQFARQSLSATIEELQSANEEMQSTNEELLASNEELQSTNEELHSVNEELYTVNAEYQRKIAELTELTDDMDNLLNSTHVDTIFLDRQLRVRKFTPDVAERFNLMRQDIGRHFESFTYRLDDDDLLKELRQVLETEQPFEREVQDRNACTYLMRILPYISRGQVEGVVLTLVDITGLKQAQSKSAELSEIVQQSSDAIFRVDRNGLIRTWNTGARKLYDRDEDIIGGPLANLVPDSMHDDLDQIIGEMGQDRGARQLPIYTIEVRGQKVYVSASISPVLDSKENWVAASVVARDVTARVQAENEIRLSIERRDQFLAMLSHELRNPLGAIVNAGRLIRDCKADESLHDQASDVIVRQSGQMARLLDDLLDVSRITLGKIELKRKIFNLNDTIVDGVRAIEDQFSLSAITFDFEPASEPLPVNGDPARLQQVIVNLLRNAIKYTPAEGTIRLLVVRDRDKAQLRVVDTGVGIAANAQDSIFEMFVQVNSSLERSQGGIGLGLTLVKAVVKMHDGTVEVFSEGEGLGSEFRVQLPLSIHTAELEESPPPPNDIQRISIIEDIPDARMMLSGILRLKGYTVTEASDGESGLKLIQQEIPDVALIDIGLPIRDGYEIAAALRRNESTKNIFLIALTGYGQQSDRVKVKEAGFDDHLVKPLDVDALEEILGRKT